MLPTAPKTTDVPSLGTIQSWQTKIPSKSRICPTLKNLFQEKVTICRGYDTIWNEHFVSDRIKRGDYSYALVSIWTAGRAESKLKEIQDLRERHGPLHPLFMFERALYLYQAAPKERKKEVLEQICKPLLAAAEFRSNQDADCFELPKIARKIASNISEKYQEALAQQIKKEDWVGEFVENSSSALAKEREKKKLQIVALRTLNMKRLPSPAWIASIDEKERLNLQRFSSSNSYDKIRKEYARGVLKQLVEVPSSP